MGLSSLRGLGRSGVFLVLLAALGLSGCSPATGSLSGKVSYNGTLLKGGSVTFVGPPGKPSAVANINEDGTYTVAGAPTGEVKVCVDTEMLNPAGRKNARSYEPPPGMVPPGGLNNKDSSDPKRYMAIPPEYASPDKTTLTLTVKGGRQTYDIDMKK
jgi:hypothetical protein